MRYHIRLIWYLLPDSRVCSTNRSLTRSWDALIRIWLPSDYLRITLRLSIFRLSPDYLMTLIFSFASHYSLRIVLDLSSLYLLNHGIWGWTTRSGGGVQNFQGGSKLSILLSITSVCLCNSQMLLIHIRVVNSFWCGTLYR